MRHITILIFIQAIGACASAQAKFPFDSASHQVIYTRSFKLDAKVKKADVYAAALAWFGDPAGFTRKNADPPADTANAKKNKRKAEAEAQFDNPRPLQMQDPISGKALGMGIIRYYGSMNNAIKLLYVKYDIMVEIKAGEATISVSNIHYFHYHPASYKQVPLYSFSGGRPCDEVGAIEALIGCQNFRDEFTNLTAYCNNVIYGQVDDFRKLLKQKKYLYDPKAVSISPAKAKSAGTSIGKKGQ